MESIRSRHLLRPTASHCQYHVICNTAPCRVTNSFMRCSYSQLHRVDDFYLAKSTVMGIIVTVMKANCRSA